MTFVANANAGTLTVYGTDEQIAMVEEQLPKVDVRRPQASIEVSLVELNRNDTKRWEPNISTLNAGQWRLNLIPSPGNPVASLTWNNTNSVNNNTVNSFSVLGQTTSGKGRILANPTIVALDSTQSRIDITQEVATFSTQVSIVNNVTVPSTTVQKQQVGVSLTLTPFITNDGSVVLSLNPRVSQITGIATGGPDTAEVQTPLISNREVNISGVRVQDGQTLIIGGLLQETNIENWRKVPGLGDIPIVGAMFRASNNGGTGNNKTRTELVLMVTPHIIKEDSVPYFSNTLGLSRGDNGVNNPNQGTIQPVGLPRFIGDDGQPVHTTTPAAQTPVQTTPAVDRRSSTRPYPMNHDGFATAAVVEPAPNTGVLPPLTGRMPPVSRSKTDSVSLPSFLPPVFPEVLR